MKHEEDQLQEQCVRYFRIKYPKFILFSVPNGGRRNLLEAVRLKRTGVLAGVPDLFLPHAAQGFHGLFIEMKSKKGKLTREQNDIKARLESEGYKVAVCRTFEEFDDAIYVYLGK